MNQIRKEITHVLIPVSVGCSLYSARLLNIWLPSIVLYNLPDALWLYSFLSTIAFIWKSNRRLGLAWQGGCTMLALASEFFQKAHLLPGTFDPADLLAYLIASAACLVIHSPRIHSHIIFSNP
jgi:hypothetical protein